jgi:hypothetical protein
MKERNSGFRNESSNTKRTGLFQRITAAFPASLGKSVPNAWQSLVELIYDFVLNRTNRWKCKTRVFPLHLGHLYITFEFILHF